ncbi:MAG: OmpA domain protein, partial [uncultured Sulfurovum sp.]
VKLTTAFSLTKVAFQTGSMELTADSKERLDVAAETMKNYDGYTYKIQGHTDSSGNEASNVTLSKNRAESVKAYLVSKGIATASLTAEGFGSSQPIASNETQEGKKANRRVVFEIVK